MHVATYATADGQTKTLDYGKGRSTVGGCEMTWEQVFERDADGQVLWAGPGTAARAASLRSAIAAGPGPG